MTKQEILKGASKYIKQFKNKLFVIKYGGSILDDEVLSDSILDDIVALHREGINVILVHGGGSAINRLMQERGKSPEFVNGLRVTDKETAQIVDEALAGVNQSLTAKIKLKGVDAYSLVSRERLTIKAKKKNNLSSKDYIGDVEAIDLKYIEEAIDADSIPVVSPVGIDEDKNLYNINADLAATEIAAALLAQKLLILTNVKGVMRDKDDEASLLSTLKEEEAKALIEDSVIDNGMIPKVQAGIEALDKGVKKVHIISGRIANSLLIEVFTDAGIGTEIIK